ncbi:tape measure protein [Hydrogenobacter thermophilus]|uniref:tape measure protein n=1 Tax=Hydrogenobacter thermophilus TaxID=940 RepID=UPI0030FC5F1B
MNEKLILEIIADVEGLKAELEKLKETITKAGGEINIKTNTEEAKREVSSLASTAQELKTAFKNAVADIALEFIALVGSIETVRRAVSSFVDTTRTVQSAEFQLRQLYGSAEEGEKAFNKIVEIAQRVPIGLDALLSSAAKLKSAGLEPLDESLEKLAVSIMRFGGSGKDLELAAVAIQQIAGKGTLSMEELRQQLGERIPDAIQKMAGALGYTNLGKFFKDVEKGIIDGKTAIDAFFASLNTSGVEEWQNTFEGAINILKTELMQIFIDLGKAGVWDAMVDGIKKVASVMKENRGDFQKFADTIIRLIQGLAEFAPVAIRIFAGIADILKVVLAIIDGVVANLHALFTTAVEGLSALFNMVRSAFAFITGNTEEAKRLYEDAKGSLRMIKSAWQNAHEESGRVAQTITSLANQGQKVMQERRQQQQKQVEEEKKTYEEQASLQAKNFALVRQKLEEYDRLTKIETKLVQERQARLQAFYNMLKSFELKENIAILFKLDMQLEDAKFDEAKNNLLKRKQELEGILKLRPDNQQIIDELQKVNDEMTLLEEQHYTKRLQLMSSYVQQAIRKLQELTEAYRKHIEEARKDLLNLSKTQYEITQKIYEPVKNLPSTLRDNLMKLLNLNLDLTGISQLSQAFMNVKNNYEAFFSAIRNTSDLKILDDMKRQFLDARNTIIDFVKSLTPQQSIDIFKLLGFSQSFLPSLQQLKDKLGVIFGFNETEAEEGAQRFTQIWTNAMSNVSRAFRELPELSQYMKPEDLLGAQLQKGLSDFFIQDLSKKTQDVFNAISQSIQQQISQVQQTYTNLLTMLSKGVEIPTKLNITAIEQQLAEIQKRELVIPARLQIVNEGVYR